MCHVLGYQGVALNGFKNFLMLSYKFHGIQLNIKTNFRVCEL